MTLLLQENEGLIQSFVQRFVSQRDFPSHLFEDFKQAARIGFIQAVETWKPAHSGPSPFSHWAFLAMRQEVQKVACGALPVGVPRDIMFASTHRTDIHNTKFGTDPPEDSLGRREKKHIQVTDWKFFYTPDYSDKYRRPNPGEAADIPDPEGAIDRKRKTLRLQEFLAALSAADRKSFWAGRRPDLTERAKAYVAARRPDRL